MGSRIACFWTEPSDTAEHSLRRYVSSANGKCSGPFGYHNASVVLGSVPCPHDGWAGRGELPDDAAKADPRWPTACACGYVFQPGDSWQVNYERHYRREPDNGARFTLGAAPPGAMYECVWYKKIPEWCGSDGRSLGVMLPDGQDWHIDGPSKGGGKWTRTGAPPRISVTPSILTSRYHGFLTDGVLVEC